MAAAYSLVYLICNHRKRKISTNPICCHYVTPTNFIRGIPTVLATLEATIERKSTYVDRHFFPVDQCRKTGRAFFFRVHGIVTDEIFRVWTWKLFYLACWQQDKNLKKSTPLARLWRKQVSSSTDGREPLALAERGYQSQYLWLIISMCSISSNLRSFIGREKFEIWLKLRGIMEQLELF